MLFTVFQPLGTTQLSQDGAITLAVQLERTKNWADAQLLRDLAYRAAHPDPVPFAPPGEQQHYALMSLEQEIACALHWSPGYAAERIHVATVLMNQLPATLALMDAGRLSYLHARSLVSAVSRLTDPTPALIAKLEERVLKRATERTVSEFRADLRRAVAALDPADAAAKHGVAAQERRVCYEPAEDAMAWLNTYLPAPDAQTVMVAVQAVADQIKHQEPGDQRTADQLRADALTTICASVLTGDLSVLDGTGLPKWQGRRPTVDLVIALSTLIGEDDQPAELAGYGPIPASLGRLIASDPTATWRRMLTDQHGQLLDYGTTTYRPPADLREFVLARDRTCRGPGCHRPARRCDLDHEIDYAEGGPTNAESLTPKCERHHYTKQFTGWESHRQPDGTVTWTSPTGRTYDKPPDPKPRDRTRLEVTPSQDDPPF
jgi:hypothetical protein